MRWRLRLFGAVSLEGFGFQTSAFGTVRSAKLLALLALSRSGTLGRDQLGELLWPGDFPDATRLRLRQEMHRLKKALGPAQDLLSGTPTEVLLDRSELDHDLAILRGSPSDPRVVEIIESGEFLPGWDDEWADAERTQAEALRLQAAVQAGRDLLQAGKHTEALNAAQAAVARHPYNEEIRLVKVEAIARLGSLTSAVAEMQEFRRRCREDLGVEPSPASLAALEGLQGSAREETPISPSIPPSVGSPSPRAPLPVPLESLVGRRGLLSALESAFSTGSGVRLATLVGPGGIGKTRLAIEAGHTLASPSRRVLFVTLAHAAGGVSWDAAILAEMGLASPNEDNSLPYLASILNTEPTLLILDNAETFLPELASGVKSLLELAGNVSVLATALFPLKVWGEVPYFLGPLEAETEGRDFLLASLRMVRPLSAALAEKDDSLAELARHLDGYPLALRLASARLRVLSPRDLLARLKEGALLEGPGRDLPERHKTLDDALAASFAALNAEDREALEVLAAFPAGPSLSLAEEFFPSDPITQLERLMDSSLLSADDTSAAVRFRVLSPIRVSLQARAGDQWPNRRQTALQGLVRWLDSLPASTYLPLTQEVLASLDQESANIFELLDWAASSCPDEAAEVLWRIYPYAGARSRQKWLLPRLERALASCHASHRPRLAALRLDLQARLREVEFSQRAEMAKTALSLAETCGDRRLSPFVKGSLAHHLMSSDVARAEQIAREALAESQEVEDPHGTARLHRSLGSILHFSHRDTEACRQLRLAMDLSLALKDSGDAAAIGTHLAAILAENGLFEESEEAMKQAAQAALDSRSPLLLAAVRESQGRIALQQGDPVEAEPRFRESLAIWSTAGVVFQEADQLLSLTRALLGQERWAEATVTLRDSAEKWFKVGEPGGLCQSMTSLALILHHDGRSEEARKVLGAALSFQESDSLVLIKPEISFREKIIQLVGEPIIPDSPPSFSDCLDLFSLLP